MFELCIFGVSILAASTAAASPALDTSDVGGACHVMAGIDIQNSTFLEQDENTPSDCCSACGGNPACSVWTFVPPSTCMLKSNMSGRRIVHGHTSGCRDESCSKAPSPPPSPPAPPNQVCNRGTVCSATYSINKLGCCPYENATCCPNKQTCCPAGTVCEDSGTYSTTCKALNGSQLPLKQRIGKSVCKPGAALPLSKTLPNVFIVGDSVSIGYTPYVAKLMSNIALVQHSPYDNSDGGAEETAYGLQCLDYFFQSPRGEPLKPDVIMFNWGLHDGPLGNKTIPGQAGLPDVYKIQLQTITQRLLRYQPQAHLLFALTSPSMCDARGDGCVLNLNNQAAEIMHRYNIPTINLHTAVVDKCGPPPQYNCFNQSRCFCPHCSGPQGSPGYMYLAKDVIVPALKALLTR